MTKQKNQKKKQKNYIALDHSSESPTLLSYLCIFLGLGWFPIFPLFYIFRVFLWNYLKPFFVLFCLICIISALYPIDRDLQPQFLINFGTWMTQICTSYFSFKVECEDYQSLTKIRSAIYAVEPHGVLPVTLYWGTLNIFRQNQGQDPSPQVRNQGQGQGRRKGRAQRKNPNEKTSSSLPPLPPHRFLCALSSSILSIPIMKHFLTWSGAISVEKKNLIKYLHEGYSLTLCPGGVQEVKYLNNNFEIILFLKRRHGLTKLCLEEGCPLIPVVTYGLHKIYDYYLFDSEYFLTLGRKMGFFPMIFFGLGNIPFAQPKPAPLTLVIGRPIQLPKIMNPTKEEIERYHGVFIEEMSRVFEENKVKHGMGEYTLRIE
jgi:hypothetical protein